MRSNGKIKRIACLLMAVGLIFSLAACKKTASDDEIPPNAVVPETPPDGFVDNEIDPNAYTEDELYFTDPEKNAVIGVKDETVYYNGAGFNLRFAVNMITSNGGDKSAGLAAGAIKDRVDLAKFGDREYTLDQLIRPRTDGFAVLSMMAADFGIDIYGLDENNNVVLAECAGTDLSGEELREAYSERADFEDYTVLVYYLHAHMNGMASDEYDKCRGLLEEKYGIDHSSLLDGTLAVMLYHDVNGYDLFYAIAAAAPGYWTNAENFSANMDNSARHDITKCCMILDGGTPVGFVNQVFIRCDQDVPYGEAGDTAGGDTNTDDNAGDGENGEDADAGAGEDMGEPDAEQGDNGDTQG